METLGAYEGLSGRLVQKRTKVSNDHPVCLLPLHFPFYFRKEIKAGAAGGILSGETTASLDPLME